jgi:hypothetical protein
MLTVTAPADPRNDGLSRQSVTYASAEAGTGAYLHGGSIFASPDSRLVGRCEAPAGHPLRPVGRAASRLLARAARHLVDGRNHGPAALEPGEAAPASSVDCSRVPRTPSSAPCRARCQVPRPTLETRVDRVGAPAAGHRAGDIVTHRTAEADRAGRVSSRLRPGRNPDSRARPCLRCPRCPSD